MPTLKIEGMPPLDGEYPLDITSFTNRELHVIKQETGVRAGEIQEAFAAGDNDLLVAITLIVLQRAEKGTVAELRDTVWDADAGSVAFDLTDDEKKAEEEAGKIPPATGPDSTGSSNGASGSSGVDSSNIGGRLASVPSPTGSPPLVTGATSDPVTSAS